MERGSHNFQLMKTTLLILTVFTANTFAADLWLAVGYGGSRIISHDGLKWEITAEWAEKGGDDSNNLMGLAYGHGMFVAVGGGGFAKDIPPPTPSPMRVLGHSGSAPAKANS